MKKPSRYQVLSHFVVKWQSLSGDLEVKLNDSTLFDLIDARVIQHITSSMYSIGFDVGTKRW